MSQAPTTDELGIDDPEQFSKAQEQKLERALESEHGLSADAKRARDALLGDGPETATVDLAEVDDGITESVEIKVRTELPGDAIDAIEAVEDCETERAKAERFIDAILAMVVGPPGYDERAAWQDVYEQRGPAFLGQCTEALMAPAADLDEAVESFRDDAAGPG